MRRNAPYDVFVMKITSIRLRDDQSQFINAVVRERNTDLSAFVRLCVDHAGPEVVKGIPVRLKFAGGRIVSLGKLQRERRQAKRAGRRKSALERRAA
jgi:hypothetical protein